MDLLVQYLTFVPFEFVRFPGCKVEVKDNIEAEVLAALTGKFPIFDQPGSWP